MRPPRPGQNPVDWLVEITDEAEASEKHSILVCDPSTGRKHIVGPYPSRLSARVAVEFVRARNIKADHELANLVYEIVLTFSPEEA